MRRSLLLLIATAAFAVVLPTVSAVPTATAANTSVKKAQRLLNGLRCDAGPVDGRMGTHTRSALIRFQSRHGLPQTGRLGGRTSTRLNSPSARRCDIRPVPKNTGKGRRIVISQGQNWIWLIGGNGRVTAQGGIVDNPKVLRKGTWRTGSYCGRGARIKVNRSIGNTYYLDNFVRFAPCGIGFHRIPRKVSNGAQMHAEYYLGTNLLKDSAGCVRLSKQMAKTLWSFTSTGRTTVRVV